MLEHRYIAARFRLQLGVQYRDEIDRLVTAGLQDAEAIDIVLSARNENLEFARPDGEAPPEGNFVTCLSCRSRLELLDHQVKAERFTCPMCDIRWQFH